jgi:hypothetical protein
MGNVLSKEKREQVMALSRLGWSLRRIEQGDRSTSGDGWRLFEVSRVSRCTKN